jgi:hypothetical protein
VGNPNLSFFNRHGSSATVADDVPALFVNDAFGFDQVAGQVLHASDFVADDQGNALNPGGVVRTLSGRGEDGSLLVAWDDRICGSDMDFNDVIVRAEGPGLGAGEPGDMLTIPQPEGEPGTEFLL